MKKCNKIIYLCSDNYTIKDIEKILKHEEPCYEAGIGRDKLGVYLQLIYNKDTQSYEITQISKTTEITTQQQKLRARSLFFEKNEK